MSNIPLITFQMDIRYSYSHSNLTTNQMDISYLVVECPTDDLPYGYSIFECPNFHLTMSQLDFRYWMEIQYQNIKCPSDNLTVGFSISEYQTSI